MNTPQDLLELAKRLRVSGAEVDLRCAVSRAYYALFHFCNIYHSSLPFPGIAAPSGKGGDHFNLAHKLKNVAPELSKHNPDLAIKSKQLGTVLDALRGQRHDADYDLYKTQTLANCDMVLIAVEKRLLHSTGPVSK